MGKRISIDKISIFLKDGMTIFIGGFMGCGNAYNIIDEILKTDVKDLTLVSTDTARDEYGIGNLIYNGATRNLMFQWLVLQKYQLLKLKK